MKRHGLKSFVFLLMFSFLITFVSAGNVIFRNGEITSSETIYVLGNESAPYNFAKLELYQNPTTNLTNNPVWQMTHRSEPAYKNALLYYFYNGTDWFNPPLAILPNSRIGVGTLSPKEKLDVNGSIYVSGGGINVTSTGNTVVGINDLSSGETVHLRYGDEYNEITNTH